MKVIALLIGIFALSQAATLKLRNASRSQRRNERLACYDKAATPAKTDDTAAVKAPKPDPPNMSTRSARRTPA